MTEGWPSPREVTTGPHASGTRRLRRSTRSSATTPGLTRLASAPTTRSSSRPATTRRPGFGKPEAVDCATSFRNPKGRYGWNPVWSAVFAPDGKRVATASEDGLVRIWTVGAETKPTVLRGHSHRAEGVEFAAGGQRLLSWGGKEARLWYLDGRSTMRERVLSHSDGVQAAGFSDDGGLVATAAADGSIRLWESATGALLDEWHGHGNAPFTVDFSGDGRSLVTASADRTARIWEADTGAKLRGHDDWVNAAAFNPRRDEIVTASADGLARVWRPAGSSWRPAATFAGHVGALQDAAYSADGNAHRHERRGGLEGVRVEAIRGTGRLAGHRSGPTTTP